MKRDFKRLFSLMLVVAVLAVAFVFTAAPVAAEGEITTAQALVEANVADNTIVLGGDIEIDALILADGVTLDLNGHTLQTGALVGTAPGANVQDSSSAKTGLVKCAKETGLALREENTHLPVWNGVDGYMLLQPDVSAKYQKFVQQDDGT